MMRISYEIIRSKRKTVSLQITPEGKVLLRCPMRYPAREAEAFVQSKQAWIEKHLSRIEAKPVLPQLTAEEVKYLARQAARTIPERVRYYAPQVGVCYGRLTIRSQHTRWGSCSAKGNLNFNCLLMCCPPEVLDYVVVHELCHRKEMNHSPRFWAEVEKILPDYRGQRKWLKDNGGALIRQLPE